MNIIQRRLYNQYLTHRTFETPADVVSWLGAVQAQEYAHAKWALGLRMRQAVDPLIEQAFTEGAILRTHVMRPTWHFVTPADIRWLLALTAPRVNIVNGYMYRQLELDDALFLRSNAAIAKALEGGKQLTRSELALVLKEVGIVAEGMRLGYIVHRAELDAIVCSGARRGKQFTYALLAERAPQAKSLERDEALAELTRRYFTSHGPAMIKDFTWWSGLTMADAKAGLEMVGSHLVKEVSDGRTYWFSPDTPAIEEPVPTAHLLPIYDEYTVAYKDHTGMIDPEHIEQARNVVFGGVIVMNGQGIGSWKRTFSKQEVIIESAPFRPFTAAERDALAEAAERYGEFLGMPVVLV